MFKNLKRSYVVLGGAVGLTLLLGTAAVAGVVPRPAASSQNAAAVHEVVATDGGAASAATSGPGTTAAPVADATTVPPDTTPPTAPATTAATSAPKVKTTTPATTPATTAVTAPATTAPTAPPVTAAAKAPRTNPTDAQVTAAMQQLHALVPLLPVNVSYGRQFGDAVCSSFDQGNSYSQVKTQVLQAVSQIPLLSISSANADTAIKTAVQLFCPGYAPKLP